MKTQIDGSIEDDNFVYAYNAVELRDDLIREQMKQTNRIVLISIVVIIILVILAGIFLF